MSRLQSIASEIVRLSDNRALTPVIVTPRYLRLRPVFLAELSDALMDSTDRPIRIDWCRPVPSSWSLVSDQLARFQAGMVNRHLAQLSKTRDREVLLQITASISRPGGAHRHLVVGWCCDDYELPSWTVPIHLTGEPMPARSVA